MVNSKSGATRPAAPVRDTAAVGKPSSGREDFDKVLPIRPLSGANKSVERILDGAWEAIVRRGLHKFSMTDVCETGGVSRGTLYRYFPAKELLLEAMFARGAQRFEAAMLAAIEQNPAVAQRLRTVAEFKPGDIDEEKGVRLLAAEPGFVLHALNRYLSHHLEFIARCLEPVFAQAEQNNIEFDREQIADLIVRQRMSHYLLPSNASSQHSAAVLVAALENMLGIAPTE